MFIRDWGGICVKMCKCQMHTPMLCFFECSCNKLHSDVIFNILEYSVIDDVLPCIYSIISNDVLC